MEGDGFPRQIAACPDYAARLNLKIAGIYREEAVSGDEETLNQLAWAQMMDALPEDGVFTPLACIIREEWRSDEFLARPKYFVTRADFFCIASLISKQLVRTKSGF